jgi:DeoR/GlpR family transcriptional regulator of sugar metabolism
MKHKARNPAARRLAIQRQMMLDGTVTVETLSRELGVSVATIRRDLTSLEAEGVVSRTHGGAIIHPPRGADQAFSLREQIDPGAKARIARSALPLIEADQTVVMNDGSTILALAREIVAARMPLTVVTPGVNIAVSLSEEPQVTAYLLGGTVRHRTLGTSGHFAEEMLKSFNPDIAFIAAEGFSVDQGLSYSYESDSALAQMMRARARTAVVLATARKLSQRDRITALAADEVDVLITDCVDPAILDPFKNLGIRVIVADSGAALHSAGAEEPTP